jgi:aromatic-amino-acid transaminase
MGMTEAFLADPAPEKINLGVGVYLDDAGKTPLMSCVHAVEQDLATSTRPRGYLPMTGLATFDTLVQKLVFGPASSLIAEGRVVTLQAIAGTGALRVGAGLLALATPDATVMLSDPSWENHELLFTRAGFRVARYRYYDPATRGANVEAMVEDLAAAAPGTIVVLHASCHNPTGSDLTREQWAQVITVIAERGLIPFLDFAYQGLSNSVESDRFAVEAFGESGVSFLVANSFSKNFGLYGERIGAIHFVTKDAKEAERVLSQAKVVVRAMYSNPPTQGAAVVSTILASPELRASWDRELAIMRNRIKSMRVAFRTGLEDAGITDDLSFITDQAGMFSYSGLSAEQMVRLREEFHVYGLASGRLCIAAMNSRNIDRVVAAVAEVMKV